MDISVEYILQCEKAVEIQKKWKPEEGDFCWWRYGDKIFIKNEGLNEEIMLWLPRQDQLQEMMKSAGNCLMYVIDDFIKYYQGLDQRFGISMEQLWFAFVMKEKYNKEWNGTDWKGV